MKHIGQGKLGPTHPLISVERARMAAIAGVLPITGSEQLPLADVLGRVLDGDVNSSIALPPFDQSAMDGYAVRSAEFVAIPTARKVTSRIAAGQRPAKDGYPDLSVVRILTGAEVPPGFDAVIMQEFCDRAGDIVSINHQPVCGENIRRAGEDVQAGATLVASGTTVDARHIAIMAAGGIRKVDVRRKVKVGLISTGSELCGTSEELQPGRIYDSNKPMLAALLTRPGIDLHDCGHVTDDPDLLAQAFFNASESIGVLVSTGGISVGEEDHVQAAIASKGGYVDALRAGIKPGKPVAIGRLGNCVLLALPGNPLSALVTFLWFARPVIEKRMGMTPSVPTAIRAQAGFHEERRPGRDEFVPVAMKVGSDGRLTVSKLGRGGSSRLSPLVTANGLARIPGNLERIQPGEYLDVYPFSGALLA